jgi:FkbM family methyltransferase
MPNLMSRAGNLAKEVSRAIGRSGNLRSAALLSLDSIAYRASKDAWWSGAPRDIQLRDELRLRYRRNRGDWWSFREVWLFDCYRLPFRLPAYETLVDLGGNIGLTSLWLAKAYGFKRIAVVEPVSGNAELAEYNLRTNLPNANIEIIRAAVGPVDGIARFSQSSHSNQGHVNTSADRVADEHTKDIEVPQISMSSILERLGPDSQIDVLKLDIEGGEQALIDGDLKWLASVRSIIAEFHPTLCDYQRLIHRIEQEGFIFLPAKSVFPESMDSFIRADLANYSNAGTSAP